MCLLFSACDWNFLLLSLLLRLFSFPSCFRFALPSPLFLIRPHRISFRFQFHFYLYKSIYLFGCHQSMIANFQHSKADEKISRTFYGFLPFVYGIRQSERKFKINEYQKCWYDCCAAASVVIHAVDWHQFEFLELSCIAVLVSKWIHHFSFVFAQCWCTIVYSLLVMVCFSRIPFGML